MRASLDGNLMAVAETASPLDDAQLDDLLAYWDAANYLTVAQIYLRDNPLLREPLRAEHIKPRLLGHWGTSPGLNLVYAHLNRLIRRDRPGRALRRRTGPRRPGDRRERLPRGHLLRGLSATSRADAAGLRRALAPVLDARRDPEPRQRPDARLDPRGRRARLRAHARVRRRVRQPRPARRVRDRRRRGRDRRRSRAPGRASASSTPTRDGAVLPILHLNELQDRRPDGARPRAARRTCSRCCAATATRRAIVAGDDPRAVHRDFAAALDAAHDEIRAIQHDARAGGAHASGTPRWPAIVLRTPKGWTGPREVDGMPVEGTFRSHQVPLAGVRENPEHLAQLERWMRSYRPEELLRRRRRARRRARRARARRASCAWARSRTPTAAALLEPLDLPDPAAYALDGDAAGGRARGVHAPARRAAARRLRPQRRAAQLPPLLSRRDELQPARRRLRGREPLLRDARPGDDHVSPHGRVMEVLCEHNCQGWLEGYLLTGRHGLFATYEAFAMVSASMAIQHAKWLQHGRELPWRAPVASLNVLLTSTCWRNDHNGFSHQGPGLIDTMISMSGERRARLPAAGRQLPAVGRRPLPAQPRLRQPDRHRQAARAAVPRHRRGARALRARRVGTWDWAGNASGHDDADVVLACVGDVPDAGDVAAAALLREHVPELRFRVVNVVDLMALAPARRAPARHVRRPLRGAVRRRRPTSSSPSTATRARCTSSCTAGRTPTASTCAATASRARRRRRSTWSCSTR